MSTLSEDYKTAKAFSYSWNTLPWGSIYTYGQFQDWLSPLTEEDIHSKDVLELGCGNASLMWHLVKWKPGYLLGLELGDSVYSAIENMKKTDFSHWEVKQADMIHYNEREFDVVYSIGVLHHLKDPYVGFKSVLRATKRGGRFHCWVYAKEGNELIRICVEPLRKMSSKLPWWITKYLIATPLAAPFYIYAKGLNVLKNIPWLKKLPLFEYCLWISQRELSFFRHVAFDQLVTPRTVYIDKTTIIDWFNTHKEIDKESVYIIMRNGNSWKFGGRKKSE